MMTLFLAMVLHQAPSTAHFQTDGRININKATAVEMERLPGIGRVLAGRIVEHRRLHGKFRRIEDVIIVRGMSAARFRRIARLICI